MYQACTGAAHRLRDEEARGIAVIETGGVELDELGIDDAHACAPGHADAVAARAVRVRRTQVDLSQAAGGEHRLAREDATHADGFLVEDVGADARTRVVDRQAVEALVRRRQQVHGGMPREQRHIGMGLQRLDEREFDGLARVVGGVGDARHAVAALQRQRKGAVRIAVECDVHAVEQNTLERAGPVFGQKAHGLRVAMAGPCALDVLSQQIGGVLDALVDNAALRPVRVGVLGLCGTRGNGDGYARIGQHQRGSRPGNATAQNEDVCFQVFRHT